MAPSRRSGSSVEGPRRRPRQNPCWRWSHWRKSGRLARCWNASGVSSQTRWPQKQLSNLLCRQRVPARLAGASGGHPVGPGRFPALVAWPSAFTCLGETSMTLRLPSANPSSGFPLTSNPASAWFHTRRGPPSRRSRPLDGIVIAQSGRTTQGVILAVGLALEWGRDQVPSVTSSVL